METPAVKELVDGILEEISPALAGKVTRRDVIEILGRAETVKNRLSHTWAQKRRLKHAEVAGRA